MQYKETIKIDESILFLYNNLKAVKGYYVSCFPPHIEKALNELIDMVEKEYTKDYMKNKCIVNCELQEKITFEDYNFTKKQAKLIDKIIDKVKK